MGGGERDGSWWEGMGEYRTSDIADMSPTVNSGWGSHGGDV